MPQSAWSLRASHLALATLLVSVGLLGTKVVVDQTPSTTAYRLEPQHPPLDVARWLAAEHPDYFFLEGPELRRWAAALPAPERALVASVSAWLLSDWVARRAVTLPPPSADLLTVGREAIRIVRHDSLSQLELSVDHDLLPDAEQPDFELGAWGRLVRGLTNCDGQNHLLALLLAERHRDEAPGLSVRLVRPAGGGHLLVQLDRPGSPPLFIDGWANTLPFSLAGPLPGSAVPFEAVGTEAATALAGRASRVDETRRVREGTEHWMLPAVTRRERSPWPRSMPPPRSLRLAAPAPTDRRGAYLTARVQDLFGDRSTARSAYAAFQQAFCRPAPPDDLLCDAARLFGAADGTPASP